MQLSIIWLHDVRVHELLWYHRCDGFPFMLVQLLFCTWKFDFAFVALPLANLIANSAFTRLIHTRQSAN